MLFLLKQVLRLSLLFTALTLISQLALILHTHYQHADAGFWSTLPSHLYSQYFTLISKIVSLNVQDLFLVETSRWLLLNKPHYVIPVLLAVIFYYNMRLRMLDQPLILSKQPRIPVDEYQRYKKQNTERQLVKLMRSPQFLKWRVQDFLVKIFGNTEDEVMNEFTQKEEEIYG